MILYIYIKKRDFLKIKQNIIFYMSPMIRIKKKSLSLFPLK